MPGRFSSASPQFQHEADTGSVGGLAGMGMASSKAPAGRDVGAPGGCWFMGSLHGLSSVYDAHGPCGLALDHALALPAGIRIKRRFMGSTQFLLNCIMPMNAVLCLRTASPRSGGGSWEVVTVFRPCMMPMNRWERSTVNGQRSTFNGRPSTIDLATIHRFMGSAPGHVFMKGGLEAMRARGSSEFKVQSDRAASRCLLDCMVSMDRREPMWFNAQCSTGEHRPSTCEPTTGSRTVGGRAGL
jgi:hypothetical protein